MAIGRCGLSGGGGGGGVAAAAAPIGSLDLLFNGLTTLVKISASACLLCSLLHIPMGLA